MFDYVVIGGGSAGCVLASRLTEDPSVRVALLEAGSLDSSALIHCPAGLALMSKAPALNWRFETVPQGGLNGRRGYQPRGRVLGGSSSINAMVYIRGQAADYDTWAADGNPGWGFNDLLPYFKRAEHNSRGANAWHGQGGPLHVQDLLQPNRVTGLFVQAAQQAGHAFNADFNGADQEGVGAFQVTHQGGERCSAAKAYLGLAQGRPNLQVITGAHATRILFEGRRAIGVEYLQGGSLQQAMARCEVLLTAGALQSPQLLMLSGVGPADHLQALGLPVHHALPGVGAHLHDHVDVTQVVDAPSAKDLFGLSLHGLVKAVQGILEWRRHRTGMLTTNFAEAGGFIRSSADRPAPDLQLHFVIGKLINHGRKPAFGHGFSCHVCLLDPQSRGSLRLASPDPLAAPLIDPAFLQAPDDLTRLVRGFKLMRQILQQPALAALGGRELDASAAAQSDAQIADHIRNHADTIYHPVGSCRMGPGDNDVVDADLRVKGLAGLRVVDASIMPRVVSGNTNAPTIAIAEKGSDLIKAARKAA